MAYFSDLFIVKLWVIVKPQAKQTEVKKIADGIYSASVQAAAREGKANQALIEALADHFSVPQSSIRIIQGQTGKRKLVEIT